MDINCLLLPTSSVICECCHVSILWKIDPIVAAVAKTDWPESGMSGTQLVVRVCTIHGFGLHSVELSRAYICMQPTLEGV